MMAYKAPVVNNSAATAIISSQIVGDPPASYVQLFQDIFKMADPGRGWDLSGSHL